jgi:hypothetical protein
VPHVQYTPHPLKPGQPLIMDFWFPVFLTVARAVDRRRGSTCQIIDAYEAPQTDSTERILLRARAHAHVHLGNDHMVSGRVGVWDARGQCAMGTGRSGYQAGHRGGCARA